MPAERRQPADRQRETVGEHTRPDPPWHGWRRTGGAAGWALVLETRGRTRERRGRRRSGERPPRARRAEPAGTNRVLGRGTRTSPRRADGTRRATGTRRADGAGPSGTVRGRP